MSQYNQMGETSPINQIKGFRIHLLIFLLTTPVIWLVWYFTGTTYLWPLWQTGGWAIGTIFHYLGVFVFKNKKNAKVHNY